MVPVAERAPNVPEPLVRNEVVIEVVAVSEPTISLPIVLLAEVILLVAVRCLPYPCQSLHLQVSQKR